MSVTTSRPSPRSSLEFPIHSPHSQVRPQHPLPAIQTSYTSTAAPPPSGAPTSGTKQNSKQGNPNPPSPAGYFGLVLDPGEGQHAKNNWSSAGSSVRSTAARSPRPVQFDHLPTPFQMQSEAIALSLKHPNGHIASEPDHLSGGSIEGEKIGFPLGSYPSPELLHHMQRERLGAMIPGSTFSCSGDNPSRFSLSSSSLPPNKASHDSAAQRAKGQAQGRPSALPDPSKEGDPVLLSASHLAELLDANTLNLLLLDVRTYNLYAESRIERAVNLCIPTTLLKRPSFNVTKLSETFAKDEDKEKFATWKDMKYIVVYDTEFKDLKDPSTMTSLHTLNKFVREGWKGQAYVLKGGFNEFSSKYPEKVDENRLAQASSPTSLSLPSQLPASGKRAPGALYCPLPTSQKSVVNPFFSNIRQNMDLIGGVGEVPIALPQNIGSEGVATLPVWLKKVVCEEGGSKVVADRFLRLEEAERERMQEALNISVVYDSPTSTAVKPHTLAGVEKGTKNRYNNIWPYDHARVRLLDYPKDECDYVNASHVSAQYAPKRYIASQAPLPTTFRDFWSMVWEQDVRVIVMLTAEEEGGQVKSHRYWEPKNYGPLKLTSLSERRVSLDPSFLKTSPKRRSVGTALNGPASPDLNVPFILVRKFTLEHVEHPFSPMREITQLQYSSWPDFGAPAHPAHILGLIEHTDAVVRSTQPATNSPFSAESAAAAQSRPVLVHCSAGCGRTGTFCAVDSVLSLLRRQRLQKKRNKEENSSGGSDGEGQVGMKKLELNDEGENSWLDRDDEDLISKVVSDFRDQRLSMVQSLRQFVLCYETVLEWFARQSPLDSGKRKA
ncbi:unnamed protein product [Tuber aestivum]|uniref:protein-tyrosine-phosphatase n=1 Tax=Tuber aestivum TaxID=59557 RepID=A0A292PVY2_9PEZI|nr:unnamed protein product [Tuber aestivum]